MNEDNSSPPPDRDRLERWQIYGFVALGVVVCVMAVHFFFFGQGVAAIQSFHIRIDEIERENHNKRRIE
jgi:hypothetical protein